MQCREPWTWDAVVNGKENQLTFDFLIERQNLTVE